MANAEDAAKKKDIVISRLQQREEERRSGIDRKREEKDSVAAQTESATFFSTSFSNQKQIIEQSLSQSDGIVKENLVAHFEGMQEQLQDMQKFVADSTLFLPSYEIRSAQQYLSEIQATIQSKRNILLPKKKFAFSAKKKEKPKDAVDTKVEETNRKKHATIVVDEYECGFSGKVGEVLLKHEDELFHKDVVLKNLSNCTVTLKGNPSTIHMLGLKDCRVLCGPVSTSAFLDDCINCTVAVACQQLRVHNVFDSVIYLHVTSRAIIEDTKHIKFAPYNWSYDELDRHYALSGLDRSKNNWSDVDDFNWLASDTPSPNWSLLNDQDRILEWNE